MNKLDEDNMVEAICVRLDSSIKQLPADIALRLDTARQTALAVRSSAHPAAATDLVETTQALLAESRDLAPEINSQLDTARRHAIARLQARRAQPWRRLITDPGRSAAALLTSLQPVRPASMVATAFALVTVVSLFYVSSRPAGTFPLEDEMSMIASADDLELYENLDFYLWLAENGLPN